MKKNNTFKKIVAGIVVTGTAMHLANKYIIKKATSKNLLKKSDGNFYPFKYGNIFYKVSGEGKPVLLLHDMNECSSGMEWFYLEKKLAKDYKVYTIDLLGCGRSEKPKLSYNQFLYVQLISDFVHDVIGKPASIIATGKSAASVIMASKLHKDLIHRIVLINPADPVDFADIPTKSGKVKKYLLNTPILGTFIYHMLHTKDAVFNRFINDYYSDPTADFSEIYEYYYETAHKDQSGSKYFYANLQSGNLNMNINHALKACDKEILIISGDDYYESDYVPEEYCRLNEEINCVSIFETSYLPQLEAPSRVMDLIEEFWK